MAQMDKKESWMNLDHRWGQESALGYIKQMIYFGTSFVFVNVHDIPLVLTSAVGTYCLLGC